jgi:hypothetical protein
MSDLLPLAKLTFEVPPKPSADLGRPGELKWIPLDKLRVDENYQRPVEAKGKKNIRRIVEEFHWTKFAPLIVAPRAGGVFAIIDGQHHAIAAAIHGKVPEVPCWVLSCTPEQEARAFSTINGIVTRVHPLHMFRARIASGDPAAVAADQAARAAGARILFRPVEAKHMKPGETLAGRTIEIVLARYGHDVVVMAMELITKTGDGNPGFLRADLIEGFSECLYTHPAWAKAQDAVRAAVTTKTVRAIYAEATNSVVGTNRARVAAVLTNLLTTRIGTGGKSSAPAKTLGTLAREQARRDNAPSPLTRPPAPPAKLEDQVLDYLREEGIRIIRMRPGVYSHHGKTINIENLVEMANKMRERQRKVPFSLVAA